MQAGMFNVCSGHTFLPALMTDFDLIWECNFFLNSGGIVMGEG